MVIQTRNCYGLDTQRRAYPQLLRLLSVEYDTEAANDIKRNISKIAEKCFLLGKTPSAQKDALIEIENELIEKHAELYAGPPEISQKRLYFALHVAMEIHNARRARAKQLGRQRKARQEAGGQYDMKEKITYRRGVQQSRSVGNKSPDRNAPQPGKSSVVAYIDLTNIDDSDTESREGSPELGDTLDVKIESKTTSQIKTEDTSATGKAVTQKQERIIHRFLVSCDPPMGKYLDAFSDVPESYLRPLAKWGPMSMRRKELIRQILRKGGDQVSELDVAFLDNHICAYFGEHKD